MYIDDKEYQDNVYKKKHLLKIYFDNQEVDSKYIISCERRHVLFENTEFCFGGTPAQTVELKIHKDAMPELINRVKIVSGIEGKEVPIGEFNVDNIEYGDDSTIDLSLIDDMIKFEFDYDTNIFNKGYATLKEIAEDICTKGEVELGSTSFLNEDIRIYVYDNTLSARKFLGYIAEQASAFAMIGRDGKLYFKVIEIPNSLAKIKIGMNMNESVLESVIPTRYQDRISFEFSETGELICKIDDSIKEIKNVILDEDGNVQLLVDTDYYIRTKPIEIPLNLFEKYKFSNEFILSRVRYENGVDLFERGVTDFNTLYISQENMYVSEQSQIDNIYEKCDGLDIYSFKGSSIIDPGIELGDILEIDNKFVLYQGSQKYVGRWKADINIEIMSKHQEETTTRTKTSTKNLIRRLQSRIDEESGQIRLLAQETEGLNERVSEQNVSIENIRLSVERIADITASSKGNNPLKLENCMSGELQHLSIFGNHNLDDVEIAEPTIKLRLNSENLNTDTEYVVACLDKTTHEYRRLGACRSVIIPIQPLKTYKVFKDSGCIFALGTFEEEPDVDCVATNYVSDENEGYLLTELEITAGNKDKYLVIFFYDDNLVEELSIQEMFDTIKVYSYYKEVEFNIITPLMIYDNNTYDEFVYDANEKNKARVIRRVGKSENNTLYPLLEEVIELVPTDDIGLEEGNNYIEVLEEGPGIHLEATYIVKNDFTKQFATIYQVKSSIEILSNVINLLVKETVNKGEIIAQLNLEVADGKGIVTINGNSLVINTDFVKLTPDGKLECSAGIIANLIMTSTINGSFLYKNYINNGRTYQSGLYIPTAGNGNAVFLYAGVDITDGSNALTNANGWIKHNGDAYFKHLSVNGEGGYFYINYNSGRKSIQFDQNGFNWWLDNAGNNPFARFFKYGESMFFYLHDALYFTMYDSLHNQTILQIAKYNPDCVGGQTEKTHAINIWADVNIYGSNMGGDKHTLKIGGEPVITSTEFDNKLFQVDYITRAVLSDNSTSQIAFRIPYNNTFFYVAGSTISDQRLKENINETEINSALEIIKKILHHSFDFKENGTHKKIGYIAQELEQIDKDFVSISNMPDQKIKGMYLLNEKAIIPYITKAIQEEDDKIEKLTQKVKKQQMVIDYLVNKLNCKEEIEELLRVNSEDLDKEENNG